MEHNCSLKKCDWFGECTLSPIYSDDDDIIDPDTLWQSVTNQGGVHHKWTNINNYHTNKKRSNFIYFAADKFKPTIRSFTLSNSTPNQHVASLKPKEILCKWTSIQSTLDNHDKNCVLWVKNKQGKIAKIDLNSTASIKIFHKSLINRNCHNSLIFISREKISNQGETKSVVNILGGMASNKHYKVYQHENDSKIDIVTAGEFNEKIGFQFAGYAKYGHLHYVFGGVGPLDVAQQQIYQEILVYNEKQQQWTESQYKLPKPLHSFGVVIFCGGRFVAIFGGVSPYGLSNEIWILDKNKKENAWIQSNVTCPMKYAFNAVLMTECKDAEGLIDGFVREINREMKNVNIPFAIKGIITRYYTLGVIHILPVGYEYHWKMTEMELLRLSGITLDK